MRSKLKTHTGNVERSVDRKKHFQLVRRSTKRREVRAQHFQLGTILLALFTALVIGLAGSIFIINYDDFMGRIFR